MTNIFSSSDPLIKTMMLTEYDLFTLFKKKDCTTKRTVSLSDVLTDIASVLGSELSDKEKVVVKNSYRKYGRLKKSGYPCLKFKSRSGFLTKFFIKPWLPLFSVRKSRLEIG